MFLFLDDVRDNPEGSVLCRTAIEAMDHLRSGAVTKISFDHDLGTELTGNDVAQYIEKMVYLGKIDCPEWAVHSANPVGRANITATMQAAERIMSQREDAKVVLRDGFCG